MSTAVPAWLLHADDQYELVTDIALVRRRLKGSKRHYVYVLHRPDGEPFYVGKGVAERVLQHEAEARNTKRLTHKLNVIRSIWKNGQSIRYWLDSFYDIETDALARERLLIAMIGRHDLKLGPLTNQTNGGEGASNPSEESRQRRRDSLWGENAEDSERQIANRFFQNLRSVRSVPIKPLSSFKAAGLWVNDSMIGMSARQSSALVASAIQNRVLIEPGAKIPRRLEIEGVAYIVENGVGRDMLSSGMLAGALGRETDELLLLSAKGYDYVVATHDRGFLEDAGVLMPAS